MASIFKPKTSSYPPPKTHISTGTLPPYVSPTQPPTKKSPWRQLSSTPYISSVSLTLPSTSYDVISSAPLPNPQAPTFKLHLSLHDMLTTPFFTTFIKTGTALLLSEGTPGVSTWLAHLLDGHLHLELSREVYHRCGLQGRPVDGGGGAQKHTKERWTVSTDLRAPAAVQGRNGFDRLVRAAEQVLVETKAWLFRDLSHWKDDAERERARDVLSEFHPVETGTGDPVVTDVRGALVPKVVAEARGTFDLPSLEAQEEHHDIVEWLGLVDLGSPRVLEGDAVDPYICRYSVRDGSMTDLKVVGWTGLLDREWCTQLLIEIVKRSRKEGVDGWVAVSVHAHRTEALGQVDGCTVLLQPRGRDIEGVGDEMDVDDGSVTLDDESGGEPRRGLQRFTCFQFVDTVRV